MVVYLPALVQRGVISVTLPAFLEEVVMGPSSPSPSPTPPLSPSPPPLPSPTPDRRLTWRKGCPSCDHAADVSRDDKECDLLGFHFPSSFAGVSACESEDRFGDGGSGGGGGGGGEVVVDAEMMMWCSNFRETSCFLEAKNIEVDYQTIEGGLITITSEEGLKNSHSLTLALALLSSLALTLSLSPLSLSHSRFLSLSRTCSLLFFSSLFSCLISHSSFILSLLHTLFLSLSHSLTLTLTLHTHTLSLSLSLTVSLSHSHALTQLIVMLFLSLFQMPKAGHDR